MSMYNMLFGMNPATFFFLPMLGKHPDEYPRFRDCFIAKPSRGEEGPLGIASMEQTMLDEPRIYVYTRVGGGNRKDYADQITTLRAVPEYVTDWDDDFDSTFATFEFRVPDRWVADYRVLVSDDHAMADISDDYFGECLRVFPKLEEKLRVAFGREATHA